MKCQNCQWEGGDSQLKEFQHFDLEPIPAVDLFSRRKGEAIKCDLYPLGIYECPRCGLIQVKQTPPKETFYENYIYTSSSSPDMSSNFDDFVKVLANLIDLENSALKVLDIGCNDGLLLSKFSHLDNVRLIGCDPSPVSKEFCNDRYTLHSEYFPGPLTKADGPYDIIIGTNSLAHIPDIGNCFKEIADMLTNEGMLVMEVSDFKEMSNLGAWDYIYHEHLYYYTEESMIEILRSHGLKVVKVDRIATKGGSLRVFATKSSSETKALPKRERCEELSMLRSRYKSALRTYDNLAEHLRKKNCRLFGYGACATSSVTIAQHPVFQKVDALIDDNKKRQGLYAPSSGIPILSLESVEFKENDIVIVFAWRFIQDIKKKIQDLCTKNAWPVPIIIDALHLEKSLH